MRTKFETGLHLNSYAIEGRFRVLAYCGVTKARGRDVKAAHSEQIEMTARGRFV